jgi:hypothetical protein
MKLLVKGFAAAAFMAVALSTFGSTAVAQPAQAAQTQLGPETDDPVKIRLYLQFYDNHATNRTLAYQAAKDYLQKYTKDKDQYIDYLTKWVTIYERDERKRKLPGLINEKNFAEAYSTGAKILADEPNYLRAQIDLGYAGYLAASAKNEAYNADALCATGHPGDRGRESAD